MKNFLATFIVFTSSYSTSAIASVSHEGFCPQKVYLVARVTRIDDIGHLPGTNFLVTGTDEDDAGKSFTFRSRNEHLKLAVRFVYVKHFALSAENICEQVSYPTFFGVLR
jgi:hypothetical protein